MSKITLSEIRAAADAKYAHTEIDLENGKTVTLRNPLRMDKDARNQLTTVSERLQEEGADQFEVLSEALVAAAATPAQGKALVKEFDGDVAMILATFNAYMGEVEAGEA